MSIPKQDERTPGFKSFEITTATARVYKVHGGRGCWVEATLRDWKGGGYLSVQSDYGTLACDVLAEAGISRDDIKAMDLCEFDIRALKEIRKARPNNGDPIERSRKRRAALSAPSTDAKVRG